MLNTHTIKTIVFVRDNMERLDHDFVQFIDSLNTKTIYKKKRWKVELFDGTRILAMSAETRRMGGDRGLMNVEYR
jgi:hypothetical protein